MYVQHITARDIWYCGGDFFFVTTDRTIDPHHKRERGFRVEVQSSDYNIEKRWRHDFLSENPNWKKITGEEEKPL